MPGKTELELDLGPLRRGFRELKRLSTDEMLPQLAWEVAVAILGEAQHRVPIDTGFLKNSDLTVPDAPKAGTFEYEFGFNARYAAAVHERDEVHHPQGEAHYLIRAMHESGPSILGKQVDHIRGKFGL